MVNQPGPKSVGQQFNPRRQPHYKNYALNGEVSKGKLQTNLSKLTGRNVSLFALASQAGLTNFKPVSLAHEPCSSSSCQTLKEESCQRAKQLSITIVGGGPAGFLLAYLVAKQGHQVHVFESSSRADVYDLSERTKTYPVCISARGVSALKKAGLSLAGSDLARASKGLVVFLQNGVAIPQSTACGQYLVSRAALRLFLAERCEQDFPQNITIHYGYNLATIDDAKNSATFERSKCKAPTRAATAPLTPQLSINDPILESSRSSSSGSDSDGASGYGVEQEEFISDSFGDEDQLSAVNDLLGKHFYTQPASSQFSSLPVRPQPAAPPTAGQASSKPLEQLGNIIPNKSRFSKPQTITNQYDLLIGADGARSQVRSYMQDHDPTFHSSLETEKSQQFKTFSLPQNLVPQRVLQQVAQDQMFVFHHMSNSSMFLAPGSQHGLYRGILLMPEKTWSQAATQQKLYQTLCSLFGEYLSPEIADNLASQMFHQRAIYAGNSVLCNKFNYRNIVLLGDAAHSMLATYGQGANAALESATILAERVQHVQSTCPSLASPQAVSVKIGEEFSQSRTGDAHVIVKMSQQAMLGTRAGWSLLYWVEFCLLWLQHGIAPRLVDPPTLVTMASSTRKYTDMRDKAVSAKVMLYTALVVTGLAFGGPWMGLAQL